MSTAFGMTCVILTGKIDLRRTGTCLDDGIVCRIYFRRNAGGGIRNDPAIVLEPDLDDFVDFK